MIETNHFLFFVSEIKLRYKIGTQWDLKMSIVQKLPTIVLKVWEFPQPLSTVTQPLNQSVFLPPPLPRC